MAKIELTPYQQAAVDNSGGTLLISAAAGSGKTQVLIDRMLKRVMSETDPCNIDDFLMITFTKAAASELRGKIIRRLNDLLSQGEGSAHLQAQLSRVYLAQISTVHGFCASLLRDYAHDLELPADFRIIEESESYSIRSRVMDTLLNEAYTQKDEDISATLDILGAGRDDRELPGIILRCYNALCNCRDPEEKNRQFRELLVSDYEEDISGRPWAKYLVEEFHHGIALMREKMDAACRIIAGEDWLKNYRQGFQDTLDLLSIYSNASTWDEIHSVNCEFTTLGRISKPQDPELVKYLKAVRDEVKASLHKWLLRFSVPSRQVAEDLCKTAPALRGLLALTEAFSKAYTTEKRRKHVLDYNDLEQETLRLLYGKQTYPTAAAKEISQRYVELMIDEYQDTNSVQDAIFYAISKQGKNLFFVGDVKQSIYRFRGAEPDIFTSKYYSYGSYDRVGEGEPRKILLSDNFRSSPAILSAANDVFRLTMNKRVGAVDYGEEEALRAKGRKGSLPYPAVELHCIDLMREDLDPDAHKTHYEAEFVAKRIFDILQNETLPDGEGGQRPTEPEDIVILLRALSQKATVYRQALAGYGIRAVCSNENLFETEEITFLDALFRVIDNPHQDIPLLCVLFSPVVAFSTRELARIRGGHPDCDIYTSLREKCPNSPFLRSLNELRRASLRGSVRELFSLAEEEFSLRAAFSASLHLLDAFSDLVQQFESGEQFGLSAFLRYLDRMKEKGPAIDDTPVKGAVQITTIHKSKGLEYPIVFLSDLCKGFNYRDSYLSVQTDHSFGIAAKVYDPTEHVSYPTAALQAISHKVRMESLSEEMRILYVAMTRPEHRLIMTCCNTSLGKKIDALAPRISVPLSSAVIEGAGSMGDWILMTALTHKEGDVLCPGIGCDKEDSPYPWKMEYHVGVELSEEDSQQEEFLPQEEQLPLFPFSYSHRSASETAGKLTATQLKGKVTDEELSPPSTPPTPKFDRPNFKEKLLSPAERGTAIHMAMQYIRYELCTTSEGVRSELDRLKEQKFLTEQQAAAVPEEKILAFFRSEIGQRVLNAEQVIREFKFSLLEEGEKYDPQLKGEHFLLQGVTDCCIVEKDQLTVLDFKSDHIKKGNEQERAEYYRGQIDTYADALGRIFHLPAKDKILYFFSTDSAYYLN